VYASYDGARRWLEEERERQIADAREQWEYERSQWLPDSEWLTRMKRESPQHDWDEYAATKLAEPFKGMTEIEGDEFCDGRNAIHGSWFIAAVEVQP
jgi:hypothetical protein